MFSLLTEQDKLSLLTEHGILHSQAVSSLLKGPPLKTKKVSKMANHINCQKDQKEQELLRTIHYLRHLPNPIMTDSDDDDEIEEKKVEVKEKKVEVKEKKVEVIELDDNYEFDSDDCGMDSDDFPDLDE